jgi:hypothetical protein
VANQTPEMQSLVSAISRGAGRCDAQSLNSTLVLWTGGYDDGRTYISNQMPDYCAAYTGHAYTDFQQHAAALCRDARERRALGRSGDYDRAWPSTTNASGARTKSAAVSPGGRGMPFADLPPQLQERVVCSISAAVKYEVPVNIVLAVAERRRQAGPVGAQLEWHA